MSNRKTNTIMKKFFYSVLAFAAIVACSKEKEAPVESVKEAVPTHTETIIATFASETKTTYTDYTKFEWVAGDQIWVGVVKDGASNPLNSADYDYVLFTAKAGGKTAEFEGEVPDTYRPNSAQIAYYPGSAQDPWYESAQSGFACRLPNPVCIGVAAPEGSSNAAVVSADNPLGFLPLIGSKNDDGSFSFKTGVGVVKFQLTDLEEGASGITISRVGGAMSNYFILDADRYIKADKVLTRGTSSYGNPKVTYYFTPASDGSATVYVAAPVGTMAAGTTLSVLSASGDVIFTKEFTKDVVVERNKITTLSPIKASEDWTDLGKGKFYDAFIWNVAKFPNQYAEVEIFYSAATGTARVMNPYGTAATTFNYTPGGTVTPASEILTLNVDENGRVYFSPHITGVWWSANFVNGVEIDHPSDFSSLKTFGFNYVGKVDNNGIPTNIFLSPVYYGVSSSYWTGANYVNNHPIEIIFPGAESLDVSAQVAFAEISDDTPAQPVAKVNVSWGNAYASASLVIAASAEDADAAFTAGTGVAEATAVGQVSVNLPANAASGEYSVYARFSPASGVNPVLAQEIVSEKFQYDRTDESWTELGTGKFVDNNYWGTMGGSRGTFVDVKIIQSPNDANNYRVMNPYGVAATQFGYTPSVATTPDEYLDLTVQSNGSVIFKAHNTGIYNTTYKEAMYVNSPNDYLDRTGFNLDHNFVVKYASDGKPANIILAPVYNWPISGYWTGANYISNNDGIQIVFPGFDALDATVSLSFSELADDNPAQPIAKVIVDPGNAFASVDLVIAANATDAATAFSNSEMVTTVTGTGEYEVKFPADAPSGTYYIFGNTKAAEGVSASVEGSVVSAQILYNRSDENLGITVEEVSGSYTATVTVNWMDGNSYVSDTITAKIEESDDENAGNIMFTNFVEDGVLYANLDEKTGKIAIDAGQVMATYSFRTGSDETTGDPIYTDLDLVLHQFTTSGTSLYYDMTNPIELKYDRATKKLEVTSQEYLGIRLYNAGTSSHYGLYCIITGGGDDDYVTFTKDAGANAAPKANAKKLTKNWKVFNADGQQAPSIYVRSGK